MFDYTDFPDGQREETMSSMALPYDFYEHAVEQSKRDEASRVVYRAAKEPLRILSRSETCERCGKDLERVYLWNGRKLCRGCVEDGQKTWLLSTGDPDAASQRVPARPKKARPPTESLISGFLALFDLQRIERELAIVKPSMPVKLARLLAPPRPDRKQMPEAEGPMGGGKRRKRFFAPTKS